MQTSDKCRFFKGANTFWVARNDKQEIDAMNKLSLLRNIVYSGIGAESLRTAKASNNPD